MVSTDSVGPKVGGLCYAPGSEVSSFLFQDVCASVGSVQGLDGEAGQLPHGAGEEAAGAHQGGSEVCGGAGQSTQKGEEVNTCHNAGSN